MYPWSPCPVISGRSRSRDARYSVGPLLALWGGCWRRRGSDRCVLGARSPGGGRGEVLCGEQAQSGSAGLVRRGLVPCRSVSSVCRSSSSSRLLMSRAMCVGVLPCGVAGAQCRCPGRVAAGVGWSAVQCGCGVPLLAGGRLGLQFRPRVRFGLWLAVDAWPVCGTWVLWGWAPRRGGVRCSAGVVTWCPCVDGLWGPMSMESSGWCVAVSAEVRVSERVGVRRGVVVFGCVSASPWEGGRTVPALSGGRCWFVRWYRMWGQYGVAGCSSLAVGRCGAASRVLLVLPPVFPGPWAVWDPCGVGPGVTSGGVRGIGVPQPAGCGCVVSGRDDPSASGPWGVQSAACGASVGSAGRCVMVSRA